MRVMLFSAGKYVCHEQTKSEKHFYTAICSIDLACVTHKTVHPGTLLKVCTRVERNKPTKARQITDQ